MFNVKRSAAKSPVANFKLSKFEMWKCMHYPEVPVADTAQPAPGRNALFSCRSPLSPPPSLIMAKVNIGRRGKTYTDAVHVTGEA